MSNGKSRAEQKAVEDLMDLQIVLSRRDENTIDIDAFFADLNEG